VATNEVADKVNARGETVEARLDAVHGRVDQAVIQGMHLGVSLGLVAMSSRTNEDYSIQPVGFLDGHPDEIDDIDERLEAYDDHAAALAESTNPQSILNKLFEE
jgi:tetrahydromethanopterin S-methyltransferase subunit G